MRLIAIPIEPLPDKVATTGGTPLNSTLPTPSISSAPRAVLKKHAVNGNKFITRPESVHIDKLRDQFQRLHIRDPAVARSP